MEPRKTGIEEMPGRRSEVKDCGSASNLKPLAIALRLV
jgi:hypothetical protein